MRPSSSICSFGPSSDCRQSKEAVFFFFFFSGSLDREQRNAYRSQHPSSYKPPTATDVVCKYHLAEDGRPHRLRSDEHVPRPKSMGSVNDPRYNPRFSTLITGQAGVAGRPPRRAMISKLPSRAHAGAEQRCFRHAYYARRRRVQTRIPPRLYTLAPDSITLLIETDAAAFRRITPGVTTCTTRWRLAGPR